MTALRQLGLALIGAAALGACEGPHRAAANAAGEPTAPAAPSTGGWDLRSGGDGTELSLETDGRTVIRLACAARSDQLLVNVPGFRPVASEERLSLGSGGDVVALVADPRGDTGRGGVSATGAVPGELSALVGGPVSASYGAQVSGPHPAPPRAMAQAFVAACGEAPSAQAPTTTAGPCLMQEGQRLDAAPLRAIGTEPFWGARIEGRCVTYSHLEDQTGTRVWTRYAPAPGGGTWSGALGGQPFELRTQAEPGCSDGMSDRVYPIAVELLVHGERRTGCAYPDRDSR